MRHSVNLYKQSYPTNQPANQATNQATNQPTSSLAYKHITALIEYAQRPPKQDETNKMPSYSG